MTAVFHRLRKRTDDTEHSENKSPKQEFFGFYYADLSFHVSCILIFREKSIVGNLMISLLPSTPNCLHEVLLSNLLPTRKVPSGNLRVYLHTGVGWNEIIREVVAFENRNSGLYDGIIFPARRAQEQEKVER